MRCLTLADALLARGVQCIFICRPFGGHLLDVIAQRGHKVVALPALDVDTSQNGSSPVYAVWLGTDWLTDAQDTLAALASATEATTVDWLVVDHYALDISWELLLRSKCQRLMVIDDLAD